MFLHLQTHKLYYSVQYNTTTKYDLINPKHPQTLT